MKRAKAKYAGSKSVDRISDLPQGILQRILYFLSQKEAVRTSVLSKSWRHIWCTRPNLDFSDATFKGNMQRFLSLVNKTLKLYRDQRLCVDEFHLCISVGDLDHESVSLIKKWIRILRSMSVKKFCLCNRSKKSTGRFKLPSVAFRAESLQDLHLEGFVLDRKTIRRIVLFKHITSLSLQRVSMEDEILKKILSSCPLIEIMHVEQCLGLRKIEVKNLHNLKEFYFSDHVYDRALKKICSIQIHTPSLETIDIGEGNIWFHRGEDFCNLKDLTLCDVKSSLEPLSSCKFPSLEYLRLSDCDGLKEIELFIDAPNIKDFCYEGDFIPSISFAITFSEWESHIDLMYGHSGNVSSWFLKLKELLKSVSHSEISVALYDYEYHHRHDREHINQEINNMGQDNACDEPVAVESLMVHCPSSLVSSLLNGALSICRPRNIEDYLRGDKGEMERIECLWKILMQREIRVEEQFSQLWFRDLEEVRMEVHDDNRKEWHPITLSELSNYHNNNRKEWDTLSLSESPNYRDDNRKEWHPMSSPEFDQQRVLTSTRFPLKWKQDGN